MYFLSHMIWVSQHCARSTSVQHLLLCKQDILICSNVTLHTLASSMFHCYQKALRVLVKRDQQQQEKTWLQINALLQQPMEIQQ